MLENGVAFLADVGDARAWVIADECGRQGEWIDLERHAFGFEFVGDYF